MSQHLCNKKLSFLRHPLWTDEHPEWQRARNQVVLEVPSFEVKATDLFIALYPPSDCC